MRGHRSNNHIVIKNEQFTFVESVNVDEKHCAQYMLRTSTLQIKIFQMNTN